VVAAYGISCCGFQVAGLVWSGKVWLMWLSVARTAVQPGMRLDINTLMPPVDLRLKINTLSFYWPENKD